MLLVYKSISLPDSLRIKNSRICSWVTKIPWNQQGPGLNQLKQILQATNPL